MRYFNFFIISLLIYNFNISSFASTLPKTVELKDDDLRSKDKLKIKNERKEYNKMSNLKRKKKELMDKAFSKLHNFESKDREVSLIVLEALSKHSRTYGTKIEQQNRTKLLRKQDKLNLEAYTKKSEYEKIEKRGNQISAAEEFVRTVGKKIANHTIPCNSINNIYTSWEKKVVLETALDLYHVNIVTKLNTISIFCNEMKSCKEKMQKIKKTCFR